MAPAYALWVGSAAGVCRDRSAAHAGRVAPQGIDLHHLPSGAHHCRRGRWLWAGHAGNRAFRLVRRLLLSGPRGTVRRQACARSDGAAAGFVEWNCLKLAGRVGGVDAQVRLRRNPPRQGGVGTYLRFRPGSGDGTGHGIPDSTRQPGHGWVAGVGSWRGRGQTLLRTGSQPRLASSGLSF